MKFIRSSVERLQAYVPGEQPRDPHIIKLNTNENPYPPSPAVQDALETLDVVQLRKYPDPVCHSLRECIASLHQCKPEQVFVGNGSDEVLALCTRALLERTGKVAYLDPTYSLYPVLCAIEGLETCTFSWSERDSLQAELVFLCNPNAPTAKGQDPEEIKTFAKTHKGVVLIDEAYADFAETHCMLLATQLPNVLVSRSLSKSYSLAGIRLGYVVGAEPLIEALFKIKDSYNVNMISQRLALAALEDQSYFLAMTDRIKKTRERVRAELALLGYEVPESQTNFLWIKTKVNAIETVDYLRSRNILVRYFPGEKTSDYMRVTVGTDEEMDRFLEALRAFGK